MCLAQGPQRSDAVEARTRGLSVSSQALYHWATALPVLCYAIYKFIKVYIYKSDAPSQLGYIPLSFFSQICKRTIYNYK